EHLVALLAVTAAAVGAEQRGGEGARGVLAPGARRAGEQPGVRHAGAAPARDDLSGRGRGPRQPGDRPVLPHEVIENRHGPRLVAAAARHVRTREPILTSGLWLPTIGTVRFPRVKPEHAPSRLSDGTIRLGGVMYGIASEIEDPGGWAWA